MNPTDTLLCVIDVQERLLPAIAAFERVAWNVCRLVDGASQLGVPTVATEQYPEKLGSTIQSLASRLSEPAISKLSFSAASCTNEFAQRFSQSGSEGRQRVLLAGIETHVCVQQTAYDLLAAGYQVLLAVDASGSRFDVDCQTALRRMESAGVVITTTEAALFEWCGTAGTPEFKAISSLVKQHAPDLP